MLGTLDIRWIVAGRDLAKKAEYPRLDPAPLIRPGEFECAVGQGDRVVFSANPQVRLAQVRVVPRAQRGRSCGVLGRDALLECHCFGRAPGEEIRTAKVHRDAGTPVMDVRRVTDAKTPLEHTDGSVQFSLVQVNDAESHAPVNQGERLIDGFSDSDRFGPVGNAVGEVADLGEAEVEDGEGEHEGQARLAEALSDVVALKDLHIPPEASDRLTITTASGQSHAEEEARHDLEGDVRHGAGHGEGALSGRDGAIQVALQGRAQIRGSPAEPALIVKGFREGFGFVEMVDNPAVLSERDERIPEIEAEVDLRHHPLADRWEMPQDANRLLEVGRCLSVRGPRESLGASLPQIADRLVPDLPSERVVRQSLEVFHEPVSVQRLDRRHDSLMEGTLALTKDARVGDLVRQRVLERVLVFMNPEEFAVE